MISAARTRKSIRSDESHRRQDVAKKAVARLLVARGFEVIGTRIVKNRHLIDVRDPKGCMRVLWFKLGWNPAEHGTSAVQITMLKKDTRSTRPRSFSDAKVMERVSRKFKRARADGVSDLLLFSLDDKNRIPIACLLMPLSNADAAFAESLKLDRRKARNGASPALWLKGSHDATVKLQRLVERFATEDLVNQHSQRDRELLDDAINDLAPDPVILGNATPEKRIGQTTRFPRDPRVRANAIARAKGRCELCGHQGFLMPNGERYLEAHHVLALGEEGPDTEDNVIALCANDHREAHFSAGRNLLAEKMRRILSDKLRSHSRISAASWSR